MQHLPAPIWVPFLSLSVPKYGVESVNHALEGSKPINHGLSEVSLLQELLHFALCNIP